MIDKRTLESDRKLINVLFNIEPLDFARRDDGTLVIIHPDGKKTIHSPEEIAALSDKELAARSAAPPAAKKAAAAASRSDPHGAGSEDAGTAALSRRRVVQYRPPAAPAAAASFAAAAGAEDLP